MSRRVRNGVKEYKVAILGAGGVGKTSIVTRFMNDTFSNVYIPTVGNHYTQLMKITGGEYYTLEIIDTAGAYEFPAMMDLSIRTSQAFVIVFAMNDKKTLDRALAFKQQVVDIKDREDIPIIFVGNKVDCGYDEMQVNPAETEAMVKINGYLYLEASAKYNINPKLIFSQLISQGLSIPLADAMTVNEKQQKSKLVKRMSEIGEILKKKLHIKQKSTPDLLESQDNVAVKSKKKLIAIDSIDENLSSVEFCDTQLQNNITLINN
ncbi:unnamed protein product [Owenia fusiformis]|uniref:Uncharacterized protein n=1 Tax=Owenia fusiformis TaxID=6347 RepID=A0A8J1TY40_OWEFU|nr:unnamed protein product [Owenia fusiformis]